VTKPGFLEVLLTNSPTLRCHLLEIVSSFFGKSEAVAQELPSRHAGHRALGLIDLEPQLGVTLMQQRRRIERIDALFHQSELYLTRSHLRILETIENWGLGVFLPAR